MKRLNRYINLFSNALLLRVKTINILKSHAAALLICLSATISAYTQAPVANFTGSPTSGCSPLVVNFQDLSSNSPTSWLWDFGNGSTSTLQNPTATYFTPGTYTVKLTATNASGSNTLTRTNYITIYESPTVDFSGTPVSGCFPMPVQFTDLSTPGTGNTNTAWEWNFGDGNIATTQNPLHTYTTSGTFTVTLKVTNDKGCFKILSKPFYIQVVNGVVADFTNTGVSSCSAPVTVNFTNISSGPGSLSYSWNFGDGGTSTAQHPSHTYAASGNYTVTLTVTSSLGCSATIVRNSAVVIGANTSGFTAPDTVCINSTVSFTNTSTPVPLSSFWNFGDGGTSSLLSPTHIFTSTGTFPVKLVTTFSGCTDSITRNIVVAGRPTVDFTAPVTTNCQPPFTVNFQDLSTGATSWLWNFGDGGTSTLQNPSHTYNTYGNFTVTLIATNSTGCNDTIIKPNFIRINRPVINIVGLPVQGCTPYTITPTSNIITLDAVTSYLWNFGDGFTSTLPNPAHTYSIQGTYTVSLTITTSTGCTETLTLLGAVRVGTTPVPDFSASPLVSCANEPVQFTDLSVPADQWAWDFGDGGSSSLQNPVHSFSDTGYFNITLIAVNNGCPDTITKTNYIRILPPVARFNFTVNCTIRNEVTFTDQSVDPLTWNWDFGDATTSVVQNPPVHIYPGVGTYNATLIVTNGGCADTVTHTVRVIDENPDIISNGAAICKRDSILFTASSINPSNISSYIWNFGDGSPLDTTTTTNVYHPYTTSGNYTVTLVTIDINGCRDTVIKSNFIRVNGPVANFTGTNTGGCSGLTTTFNDLSVPDGVNAIISWQWNFGDGTIQTFTAPPFTHTYNTVGTFSVSLTVTDASGCFDTLTLSNLIHSTDPTVFFSSPDTLTCPGAIVRWNVGVTGIGVGYNWDFGDGTTASVPFPTKSYSAPGLYTVKLSTTDFYGCSDSMVRTAYIRVDVPQAGFNMDDSISACVPFEVNFTNTSSFYNTQVWDFNDGVTSSVQNPSHYFLSPGTYNVKLLITSPGGCRDSVFKIVTLYDTAGSRINYGPFNGCKPLTVNFNVITPGNPTYIWDFGDGQTVVSNSPNISHTYTDFGNFIPKVILQDPGGCLIPVTGIDTLKIVGATAKFGLDTMLLCDGGLVNFIDSTTFNDPIVSYNWDFGDGGTSSLQAPSHYYSGAGFYTVSLNVLTQLGCVDTFRLNNVLKIVERPHIRIDGDSAACVFTPLQLLGSFIIPDTSVVTWSWNIGNGNTSTLQNPVTQTFNNPGSFIATAIATNSTGCKDTVTQNIRIHPLPTVSMPPSLTVVAGNTINIPATYSGNMTNYNWTPTTFLNCTNCPRPNTTPDQNITYTVAFTDSNSCVNSGSIVIKVSCKNSNVFVPNTFSPNNDGSNDLFYPRGTGINRAKHMRIFNRWGEVVFERYDFAVNNPLNGWDGSVKGKKADAGVYIYQLEIYCQNGELLTFTGNVTLIR